MLLSEAVADHDHKTGQMRGILHNRCNRLEGVVSRSINRFGFKAVPSMLESFAKYYAQAAIKHSGVLHPTHRTLEEKKERAKRARKRYAQRSTEQP